MLQLKYFTVPFKGEEGAPLAVYEANKDLPFEIKRVYFIYGTNTNVKRGKHAHKKLKQAIVCVKGSCKITFDDGINKKTIFLNDPHKAVYLEPQYWHELHDLSADAVLVVMCDDYYNEDDYLRSYDDFLEFYKIKGKKNEKIISA